MTSNLAVPRGLQEAGGRCYRWRLLCQKLSLCFVFEYGFGEGGHGYLMVITAGVCPFVLVAVDGWNTNIGCATWPPRGWWALLQMAAA